MLARAARTIALVAVAAFLAHAPPVAAAYNTLLGLANTWLKAQNFAGLDVTGQAQGVQGTTDACHFTYAAGVGQIQCVWAGHAWRQLLVDTSVETHGSQNPAQAVIFQGTGGFSVLNVPETLSKLSAAPTTAPGAGQTELFFVAGTNSGTCKLQALAGTSTTPVTIADNIGSGC